jgi:membrane protein required for colicin V production
MMDDLPITITDFIVLGIVFASGFLAYLRGAVREFFFLATWGGAIAATILLYDVTLPLALNWIGDPLLAAIANGAGIFVITLTLMTIVSTLVVKRAEESHLSALDRSLGFVFGIARGIFVVCVIYLLYTLAASTEEQPSWLKNAKLTPIIASGSEIMLSWLPEDWGLRGERVVDQLKESSSAIEPYIDYNDLIDPQPSETTDGNSEEPGYKDDDRSALDNVIDTEQ